MILSQKILCENIKILLIVKMYFRTLRGMCTTTAIADYPHTATKACSIKIMSSLQHPGLNPILTEVLACLIEWLWV